LRKVQGVPSYIQRNIFDATRGREEADTSSLMILLQRQVYLHVAINLVGKAEEALSQVLKVLAKRSC
jgi:hypothetical protein